MRRDAHKTRRPELPLEVSAHGRLADTKPSGSTITKYLAEVVTARKADPADKDPRAAILRHAADAEANPFWITNAYKEYVSSY